MPGADLAEAVRPGEFVWGTAVADRSVRLLLRHLHQDGGDHDAALQHLSALTTRIAAVREHVEEAIRRKMHFGAFGRGEWRRHDYVWGRLGGAAHLVRLLDACTDALEWKDSTDLEREQTRRNRTVTAQEAVLAAEGVTAIDFAKRTQDLRDLDGRGTLDLLRDCDDGRNAIRGVATDVLRALLPEKERATKDGPSLWPWDRRARGAEPSSAPRRSVVLGRWASVLLADPVASGVAPWLKPYVARLLAAGPRARIWSTILTRSPDQKESTKTR